MDLKNIKALILDMDGVLWHAYHPIGDLDYIFSKLSEKNIKHVFASNNGTIHVNKYVEKISKLGISVKAEEIYTSGKVAAEILKSRFPERSNIYVVGEEGLKQTLAEAGFTHSDNNVVAVIGGLDFGITYEKIKIAADLVRDGAPFIATNPDATYPITDGQSPGAGSIIASITVASGVEPEFIGKPQPTMFTKSLEYLGTRAEETLVVGDRLETDIAGAQAAGCRTAVVLTGVSNRWMAEAWQPEPDVIAEDLTTIIDQL